MSKRVEIMAPSSFEPISHYTDAVRYGDLLFVSGIVGIDKDGIIVGDGDVVRQTEKLFENMGDILTSAGAHPEDVLSVRVYLTDVDNHSKINPIRKAFFGSAKPASTLIGVKSLILPELLVEIDAIFGIG